MSKVFFSYLVKLFVRILRKKNEKEYGLCFTIIVILRLYIVRIAKILFFVVLFSYSFSLFSNRYHFFFFSFFLNF